jgi:hypothetical protein
MMDVVLHVENVVFGKETQSDGARRHNASHVAVDGSSKRLRKIRCHV